MQASRKELALLLSVFVKASSTTVLEKVRAEAVKSGALVATSSRWQQCSHSMLDSCFSLLDRSDLETAETVCKRWRAASKDSCSGWIAQFSRKTQIEENWLQRLRARCIKLQSLVGLKYALLVGSSSKTADVAAALSLLPSLTELDLFFTPRTTRTLRISRCLRYNCRS